MSKITKQFLITKIEGGKKEQERSLIDIKRQVKSNFIE